ncbi:hypothetical protein GJAV_G00230890 [Gymnothorax javanicus]|nr:hypothetical protein GJAV_G00230890 [Gymnothorax javanicus]
MINVIDTFDRPGHAECGGSYATAGTYAEAFTNKPMKRIPKAGAVASAGVGYAKAEYSIFEAQANGPKAKAEAQASVNRGLSAMAEAELGSASASAGPFKLQVGLGVDTGVRASLEGVEVKLLGTGMRIGPNPEISLFGSSVECSIM